MKNNIIILSIIIILILGAIALVSWNFNSKKNTEAQSNTHSSWIQYKNKTHNFSFLYPESMHINENDGTAFVSVSVLSPDNSQNASDIGLLAKFTVYPVEGGNIEAYIQTINQSQFTEQFTFSEIILDNGVAIITITYNDAFGVHIQKSFIDIDGGDDLSISFVRDTKYSDTFFEILRSFDWRK